MLRRRKRALGSLLASLLALGLGLVASVALAATASAGSAPITSLSFTPATGLATTPMYVIVPQPCPPAATNVLAQAFGKGFPANGQTVVTNSTSGISHRAPFILPLQDTFTGFAADNGVKLSGGYRVVLRCINRLGSKTFASFGAIVSFSDGTHYTAPAPPRSVVAAIAADQNGTGSPTGNQGNTNQGNGSGPSSGTPNSPRSTGANSGNRSAGGTKAGPAGSGSVSASAAATQSNSRHSAGFHWQPLLIAGALLLIVLAVVLRVNEVRTARRRAANQVSTSSSKPPSASSVRNPPGDSTSASLAGSSTKNSKGNDS